MSCNISCLEHLNGVRVSSCLNRNILARLVSCVSAGVFVSGKCLDPITVARLWLTISQNKKPNSRTGTAKFVNSYLASQRLTSLHATTTHYRLSRSWFSLRKGIQKRTENPNRNQQKPVKLITCVLCISLCTVYYTVHQRTVLYHHRLYCLISVKGSLYSEQNNTGVFLFVFITIVEKNNKNLRLQTFGLYSPIPKPPRHIRNRPYVHVCKHVCGVSVTDMKALLVIAVLAFCASVSTR